MVANSKFLEFLEDKNSLNFHSDIRMWPEGRVQTIPLLNLGYVFLLWTVLSWKTSGIK